MIIMGSGFQPLFRVSASGGGFEPLTQLKGGEIAHAWPRAVPSGRSVMFTSVTGEASDTYNIEVLDLETKERKVLQQGGSDGRYVPTGHLAYLDEGTLSAAPFDLREMEITGPANPLVEGVRRYSFSNTGMLAYLRGEADQPYPVVWVDRQGNMTPLWEEPGLYGNPRLSPDGKRLAMNVWRDNNMDLWIYDLERDVSTRLTFNEGRDDDHVWSPDGEYLAFSSTRDESTNIYKIQADGSGEVERLTTGIARGQEVPMSWSADGRFLAYHYIEPQVFSNTDANEGQANFSPNGRWIAHYSDESGVSEIYVRPYPLGPGKRQVSSNGGINPRWSADGRELFYRTNAGIMVVPVETQGDSFTYGRVELLFRGAFLGGIAGVVIGGEEYVDYDVSVDGQHFVMFPDIAASDEDGSGHVTLVTNWFDELERLVPTQ